MAKKKEQVESDDKTTLQETEEQKQEIDEQNSENEQVQETIEQNSENEQQIETLQKERDEYLNIAQRVQAEYDNFRKRNQNIRQESLDDGVRLAVEKIIPSLDNLERAVQACSENSDSPLYQGVEMVLRSMKDACSSLGMTEIEAKGKLFDPNFHNAVLQVPATDEYPSGTVCEVLQKGYMVRGKVVRECLVQVSK